MSVATSLVLREGDQAHLEALTRSTSVRAGVARRARIVLLAAEGVPNAEIARRTGSTRPTVITWRNRYLIGGIDALRDKPRSGRPAQVDEIHVVATTLASEGRPPEHLGASHWSARLLGKELGISFATVARIWRKWGIQPRRIETFRLAMCPELEAEFIGLYRNSHERGVVVRRHRAPETSTEPQPAKRATPHPDPWLNLVEVSLGIITHQAIRRGTFASVHNLIEAIGALTDEQPESDETPPRTKQPPIALTRHRKDISDTYKVSHRFPAEKVDLRQTPGRSADQPPDQMWLRAEFHGARCRRAGALDRPGSIGIGGQDVKYCQSEP